ncbi:MAG TPA: hypothetical protein VGC41_00840, partial [Kofleriaceae bacterium]
TWSQPHTTECSQNQSPSWPEDSCMSNWGHTAMHAAPSDTSIDLLAQVWDDDDTSGDDLMSQGTRSKFFYPDGTLKMSYFFGAELQEPGTWWNSEAVPMSRCTNGGGLLAVTVCHYIALTPVDLGN